MFRSRIISFFFFCSCLFSGLANQCAIAEIQDAENNIKNSASYDLREMQIISLVKQYRIDTTLPWNKEKRRELNIIKQTCEILDVYKAQTLQEGIEKFIKKMLFPNENFEIVNARTTEFYGKSTGEVFFIKDAQKSLRYIVKAFPDSRTLQSHFLPEVSAIDMVRTLELKKVVPIEQHGMAICFVGKDEWGLLLETAAQGVRLDQYLRDINGENKESAKREERLEIALKAFKRVGTCLACLHATHASEPSTVPMNLLIKCEDKLALILKNHFVVDKLSKHVDMDEFVKYVNEIKGKAQSVKLYCNYIHGDTHMGNIFYDASADCCSFIDLGGLHRSIDVRGEPISHATMDLTQFEDSLGFYSGHLTEKEMLAVREAFYLGYQEVGGQFPDARLADFYTLYFKLRRLVTKCDYRKETNSKVRDFDKSIFKEAIRYFQQRCPKSNPLQAHKDFNDLILKSIIKHFEVNGINV
jgi:hypothetical protein